jgi:hypothetical protein
VNDRARSEYETLLRDAYLGEVFGDELFGALADMQPDEKRREKLKTLQTVEARTATSLRRLVGSQVGGDEEQDARVKGRELAARIDPAEWHQFIRGLLDALPAFLEKFERLRDIARQPVDPALTALVNHEKAIERFAQMELDDDGKQSLKPLLDHLRRPA